MELILSLVLPVFGLVLWGLIAGRTGLVGANLPLGATAFVLARR